jgi:general secretion pathway protein A
MDYFEILNLTREPFSNSPEPGFFYQSPQHLGCLQKLELAIRLHRGLNVVMGNVGTGKTTLCRELLIRFAQSEEDRNAVEIHLLLDPAISTPREFLAAVATAFGISGAAAAESEWQLKEGIKQHLFRMGVDEKKTVVLIVDEGQKLPVFGLEILREFLNYETNECKLLQIVIFAQNEFEETLRQHPNFADRVNQFISLKPLNFRETRQMIAFRIAQASGAERPPRLFTGPGLLAVYKATGGYPRRIITLCHQSMLTMIIQNRKRAGWFVVRSCAERVSAEGTMGRRRVLIAASSLVVILAVAAGILEWGLPVLQESPLSGKAVITSVEKNPVQAVIAVEKEPALTVAAVEKEPAPAIAAMDKGTVSAVNASVAPPPASPAPALHTRKPRVLGRIIIEPGDTVYSMLHRIYGDYDEEQLQAFVRANYRIENINRIRSGDIVTLPAVPVRTNPLPPERSWVAVTTKGSLGEGYESLRRYPPVEGGLRLFPYWNPREGMVFAVLMRNGFSDEKAAGVFIQRLPAEFPPGARVIARWPEGTEFYAR